MTSGAMTKGVHHVGLTVPDVEKAATFFQNILGFKRVREVPDYPAIFVSDGTVMLTLWQVSDPDSATPFDRKTVIGLHHLALKVDPGTLDKLYEKLSSTTDVRIEFSPEALRGGPTRHMMFYIPGGIRLELIAAD